MKKIKDYIKNPMNILVGLDRKGIIRISDELYLKTIYKNHFGKRLNLKNPKTFNEKLQWLKLYDRNPDYTKMVDKHEAKDYVSKIIGNEYIIPTLGVYDRFYEIDFDNLPNEFVIKCTHDSGGLVICKNKKDIDVRSSKKKIDDCLKNNYYYAWREWPYKNVKPRIIIEKYMAEDKKNDLIDYKIMCFNGEPKMIFTCSERFGEELKVTFFDLQWNKLPFERHYRSSTEEIAKPYNLDLMLEFSKKLSKNIPFVRVDFYEIKEKLYFGELTFYPGSGLEEFNPSEYDEKIGNMLELPSGK